MKLEVVMLPVADVDRAKEFYSRAGFHLDIDHRPSETFRVVQFTPPGSACSVTFGVGLDLSEPGSVHGTHLVVTDIEEATAELISRGIDVYESRHMSQSGWRPGPHPDHDDYGTFSGLTDPDGNTWILQEVGYRT